MKIVFQFLSLVAFAATSTNASSFFRGTSNNSNNLRRTVERKLPVSISGEGCSPLMAGQNIEVGTVCATVEGQDLKVCYSVTVAPWELLDTHLWVGDSMTGYPMARNGNPKIGQFPYKANENVVGNEWCQSIPLSNWISDFDTCPDTNLYVAAHAVVGTDEDGDGVYDTETAWGAGDDLEGGSWATYFMITLTCDEDDENPPPPSGDCETAWAYTSAVQSFCTNDIDGDGSVENRWGWFGTAAMGTTATYDIFAGAGQCDISKGTLVGTLSVTYNANGSATFVYTINAPYYMNESHLYAANTPQNTIAPGQLGNLDETPNLMTKTYSFSGFAGPLYFSAHAVVCGF